MSKIETTWKIRNVQNTNSDAEFTEITFKDYRGEWTVKLESSQHLVQDLDKFANIKGCEEIH